MRSKCGIYLMFQDGSGLVRSFIVGGITSIEKHFLFREIPLTLHKYKPRAIRFEVSIDGRNENRKPCVSAMTPSLGINETRLVVHWSG